MKENKECCNYRKQVRQLSYCIAENKSRNCNSNHLKNIQMVMVHRLFFVLEGPKTIQIDLRFQCILYQSKFRRMQMMSFFLFSFENKKICVHLSTPSKISVSCNSSYQKVFSLQSSRQCYIEVDYLLKPDLVKFQMANPQISTTHLFVAKQWPK